MKTESGRRLRIVRETDRIIHRYDRKILEDQKAIKKLLEDEVPYARPLILEVMGLLSDWDDDYDQSRDLDAKPRKVLQLVLEKIEDQRSKYPETPKRVVHRVIDLIVSSMTRASVGNHGVVSTAYKSFSTLVPHANWTVDDIYEHFSEV